MKYFLAFLFLYSCTSVFGSFLGELPTTIQTRNGTNLHGTLLIPDSCTSCPLVILHAGSGPTNRDGNSLLGNRTLENNSLKYLANYLADLGFASYRFDKRMIGESLDITFPEDSLRFKMYVNDLEDIYAYFSKLDKYSSIGLIGHSEGGTIVGLAAKNLQPAFTINLCGNSSAPDVLLKKQLQTAFKQQPILLEKSVAYIDTLRSGSTFQLKEFALFSLFRPSVQPYLISWFAVSPTEVFASVPGKKLWIFGSEDTQVDSTEYSNANKEYSVMISGMNHVLKHIEKGNFSANQASYSDPAIPLDEGLKEQLRKFLLLD